MNVKRFFKLFISNFFRGLLLTIPITVIVYGLIKLFGLIDNMLPAELPLPGIGIAAIIAAVTLVGWLGSTFLAQPIKNYFRQLLNRAPLLKTIYTAISDLMYTVVGKRKSFKHPVMVRVSKEAELDRLGFITEKDLSNLGIAEGKVAVYFPFSYSFSGHLVIVPIENVTALDARSADVMKFIVSGGMSQLELEDGKEEAA